MIAVNNLGKSGLIDSNLNNAYKVVKFLADNLVTIQNLTSTVEAIKAMQDVAYIANHIENTNIHLTQSQVTQINSITSIQAQIQAILQALEDTCNCNSSTSEVSNAHIANLSIHVTQADKDKWNSLSNFDPSTLNLSTVATSGSYNDLIDKPTNNFQEQLDTKANLSLISKVGKTNNYDDLDNKPIVDQEISSSSTNAISSKAVYTAIQTLNGGYVDIAGNTYTKNQVDNKLSNYYTKSEIDEQSKRYLKFFGDAVDGDSSGGSSSTTPSTSVDLSDYYTKGEVDTKFSELPTSITSTEVNTLISNSLGSYYTKSEVDTKISDIPTTDLSNYYTKEEVEELIANITPSAVDNNEIITANNILFSLPASTSLVEDEEGSVYTLTDQSTLGE